MPVGNYILSLLQKYPKQSSESRQLNTVYKQLDEEYQARYNSEFKTFMYNKFGAANEQSLNYPEPQVEQLNLDEPKSKRSKVASHVRVLNKIVEMLGAVDSWWDLEEIIEKCFPSKQVLDNVRSLAYNLRFSTKSFTENPDAVAEVFTQILEPMEEIYKSFSIHPSVLCHEILTEFIIDLELSSTLT